MDVSHWLNLHPSSIHMPAYSVLHKEVNQIFWVRSHENKTFHNYVLFNSTLFIPIRAIVCSSWPPMSADTHTVDRKLKTKNSHWLNLKTKCEIGNEYPVAAWTIWTQVCWSLKNHYILKSRPTKKKKQL